jgi:cytochrome b
MTNPEPSPPRVLVWDLPTRLVHWLLASSFAAAFTIASLAGKRDPVFAVHMLLGAVAAFVVIARVVWGFVGSRYARFASFAFGPRAVLAYLRGVLHGGGEPDPGHNPANAWAAYGMLLTTLGVAVTGALIARGGHAVKEVHEALVYVMLAVVAAHLAGIVLHTIRRRENIALGMIDGKKAAEPAQAIGSSHPAAAIVIAAATAAFAGLLVRGYEPTPRRVTLPGIGVTLRLGGGDKGQNDAGERGGRAAGHEDD